MPFVGVLYSKPDHTPVLLDALHWEIRWVGVMETKLKVFRAMRDISPKRSSHRRSGWRDRP